MIGFPPAPLLDISGDTACFLSNTYYPVTYYTIDIIDLTGENHSVTVNVSKPSSNETQTCTSLYEAAFPSECSPYNISVKAHNKVGNSNESATTLIGNYVTLHVYNSVSFLNYLTFANVENNGGDICSCMEQKSE